MAHAADVSRAIAAAGDRGSRWRSWLSSRTKRSRAAAIRMLNPIRATAPTPTRRGAAGCRDRSQPIEVGRLPTHRVILHCWAQAGLGGLGDMVTYPSAEWRRTTRAGQSRVLDSGPDERVPFAGSVAAMPVRRVPRRVGATSRHGGGISGCEVRNRSAYFAQAPRVIGLSDRVDYL
jgi:hypothetical protein